MEQSEFSGFKTSLNLALKERRLQELKIKRKAWCKNIQVILDPTEYMKHMEEIRERVRRT